MPRYTNGEYESTDDEFDVWAAVAPFDNEAADDDDIETLVTGGELGE